MDVVTLAAAKAACAPIAQVAPGARLYNPKGLQSWSLALADALNSAASITVMGDSISVGVGSDGLASGAGSDTTYRAQGWVGQLRSLFAQPYGDPGEGFIGSAAVDNGARMTFGSGGAAYGAAGPMESGGRAISAGQTITLATPACTTVDIYTWHGGGVGSYNIDAAGAVSLPTGNNAGTGTTWDKTTVTGLANTTHSIVFTFVSGNGVYVPGVTCRLLSTGVQVHRIAKTGNVTANLVGQDSVANGSSTSRDRIVAASGGLVPTSNLLIIPLGVNDFANQNTTSTSLAQPGVTPTTYASYLQQIITSAAGNGISVLLLGEPRQHPANYPSPATYSEQNYYDQMKTLALANTNCAYFDVADIFGTEAQALALGLYTTGSVHPVRKGHGVIARAVYRALMMPIGPNAPTA